MYNFKRLIDKYSINFKIVKKSGGYYNNQGEYVSGEELIENMCGVIIPFKECEIIYKEGGSITTDDRQLFSLVKIPLNSLIIFENKIYKINANTEYNSYADFYKYILKWVEYFDRTTKN